jgi:hypothetical protein
MASQPETPRTMSGVPALQGDAGAPRALFLPSTFGEAMRFSEMMAAGNFVPAHLRGKPGDCFAVLAQAARWGMDPFAVGNKTYFVNDRMAYESQLVAAVVNSSGMLKGRLRIDWHGAGDELRCVVTGTIKGEDKPHAIEQAIKTITVKNSSLWKQSPQMQLAYYTQRLWGRLYTPEVLLGVYTEDEVREMGPANARNIGPAVVAPTRAQTLAPKPTQVIEADATATAINDIATQTAEVADNLAAVAETVRQPTPSIYTEKPMDGDFADANETTQDDETGETVDAETGEVLTEDAGAEPTAEEVAAVEATAEAVSPVPTEINGITVPTNEAEWEKLVADALSSIKIRNTSAKISNFQKKFGEVFNLATPEIRKQIDDAMEAQLRKINTPPEDAGKY